MQKHITRTTAGCANAEECGPLDTIQELNGLAVRSADYDALVRLAEHSIESRDLTLRAVRKKSMRTNGLAHLDALNLRSCRAYLFGPEPQKASSLQELRELLRRAKKRHLSAASSTLNNILAPAAVVVGNDVGHAEKAGAPVLPVANRQEFGKKKLRTSPIEEQEGEATPGHLCEQAPEERVEVSLLRSGVANRLRISHDTDLLLISRSSSCCVLFST